MPLMKPILTMTLLNQLKYCQMLKLLKQSRMNCLIINWLFHFPMYCQISKLYLMGMHLLSLVSHAAARQAVSAVELHSVPHSSPKTTVITHEDCLKTVRLYRINSLGVSNGIQEMSSVKVGNMVGIGIL